MESNETNFVDQITVGKAGEVFYRTVIETSGDAGSVTRSYHRASLMPGQPIDGLPDVVRKACADAWTPQVVAAYLAALPAN